MQILNIPHNGEPNVAIIYSDEAMVPVVVCSGCERKLLLPYRRFVNSSAVEPYWPPPREGLDWVCDACGRHNPSTQDDLQWVDDDCVSSPPPNRGVWRVEIPCATSGCSSTIVAYTQTFGRTSRRNLGLMIAKALPTPVCTSGHRISTEYCYPERIDFIEWIGPEDYLV